MELWLYNTLSRRKEPTRRESGDVCVRRHRVRSKLHRPRPRLRTCFTGRYLKYLGYEVNYFTDVDDKIIARANELGEDPINLSTRDCEEFHDMAYLNAISNRDLRTRNGKSR